MSKHEFEYTCSDKEKHDGIHIGYDGDEGDCPLCEEIEEKEGIEEALEEVQDELNTYEGLPTLESLADNVRFERIMDVYDKITDDVLNKLEGKKIMRQYLDLLQKIKTEGVSKSDRTGTGTTSLFGHQMRFDLNDGFPICTTKKIFLRSIIYELLWFLKGSTNIQYLKDNDVHIWDAWADEKGELGPVYGSQWRSWEFSTLGSDGPGIGRIDQLAVAIETLKSNPDSRRNIVTAWNPGDISSMALPPCHCLFQFYVVEGKLSCQLYQRSADVFLGVPFNITSYALLTMMIAQVTNLKLGDFIHTFGDVHIYNNHKEQIDLQLSREPKRLPIMWIDRDVKNIDDFKFEDFDLEGYDPHPFIKGEISV